MRLLKYLFIALIQGLGEILPISSSGHLAIFKSIIDLQEDVSFDVFLHFASLIAIIIFFRKKLVELIKNFFLFIFKRAKVNENSTEEEINKASKQRKDFFMCLYLVIATIPAGLVGVLFKVIEKKKDIDVLGYLGGNLLFVGIFLIVTAILLFVSTKIPNRARKVEDMKWYDALIIGLFQCLGTLPGISRSGSCIVGGASRKIEQSDAAEFAFLMAIPIMLGSGLVEIGDITTSLKADSTLLLPYIISFIVAGVVTYFCLMVFLKIVRKQKLSYFSIYCAVVGIISIVLYFAL